MSTGDQLCDLRQRFVARSRIVETCVGHEDDMRTSVPFSHQLRAGPQRGGRVRRRFPALRILSQFAKALQASAREAAHGSLLDTIGECAHQEVAAKSGRLSAKRAAPFGAKGDAACLLQTPDLAFRPVMSQPPPMAAETPCVPVSRIKPLFD